MHSDGVCLVLGDWEHVFTSVDINAVSVLTEVKPFRHLTAGHSRTTFWGGRNGEMPRFCQSWERAKIMRQKGQTMPKPNQPCVVFSTPAESVGKPTEQIAPRGFLRSEAVSTMCFRVRVQMNINVVVDVVGCRVEASTFGIFLHSVLVCMQYPTPLDTDMEFEN